MNFTPIFQAVVMLIATVITYQVIPYIKRKTSNEEQKEIDAWIRIAVTSAEQIFKGPGRGEEKKDYVLNWLSNHGIIIDEGAVDAMIESAVYELTNGFLIGEAVSEVE